MTRCLSSGAALLATLTLLPLGTRAADAAPATAAPPRTLAGVGTRSPVPRALPASDDAGNAIQRMTLAPGLEVKLWAAEPMLANPVAFNFDERGRIFVAETHRYRASTFDARDYGIVEEDLAVRNIDERLAMLRRNFGEAGLAELSIETEVVRLLEDSDGDGVADRSTIYADGFNTPLDGIASGVLARRGEVWFANIPSIWKLTGERRAETRTELSRGYGVRVGFTGHDLHGLIWGPDGKIYFSHGDRGASVKTKEGATIDLPDTGAIYRMNPDGTQLELIAEGLRNPQSLLFTENGDLFTGDNDSDIGDEERLMHIVEGADGGWRIGFQHSPLSPVERAGPWNAEKLWHTRHEGQPAYVLPPVCYIEDGPSGIAYYPGTGLNASYAGALFITTFKGTAARSGIYTYNVKPAGASYAIADARPFVVSVMPSDVRFGPDGRLYISDWVDGWYSPQRGRIYAISDPQHVNDPIVKETQQLIGSDWTKKSADDLARLLGHIDWRVRLEAQYTLAERGAASIPVLARIATAAAPAAREPGHPANLPAYARRHALWGLGHIAAKSPAAVEPIRAVVRDADPEVRAQAIKLLGDHRQVAQVGVLLAALRGDDSLRVKFFAAQSLGKLAAAQPALAAQTVPALLEALLANNDADAFLRHACAMGLVGAGDVPRLVATAGDSSRAVRIGALLALRRLGRPEIARFLDDPDPYLVREAALAINDRPIDAALPALAKIIERPITDEATLYRTLNANYRLGQPAAAMALAKFAARADAPAKLRAEALVQLGAWVEPRVRDRIVGIFRPVSPQGRSREAARDALAAVLPTLLDPALPAALRTATLSAVEKLEVASAADTLFAVLQDESQSETDRISALNALDKIKDRRVPEAAKIASASSVTRLRLAALPIVARLEPATATAVLASILAKGGVDEQKAALETLGNLLHPAADAMLVDQLKLLATGKLAPAVQLELLEAAAKRESVEIKQLLAARHAEIAASGDALAPFRFALAGGNRARGQQVYESHPVMACVRCHRIGTAPGGDAGPNLADIGTKYQREYLLEAIVKPNAKIAPGFETIVLTRKSGGIAAGILTGENDDTISLRDPNGKTVEVKKSDIAKRDAAPSSMPEIYGAILTKIELRDLVEYLANVRTFGGRGGGGFGRGNAPLSLPPPRALRDLPGSPATAPAPGNNAREILGR